ncbi:MAG: tetratricopeptide repeat protein, partial [Gemmatimonadaceae bacterium]|nr:tetratricopeptide repeat protein [Gemmatimonadaceae bacterium]
MAADINGPISVDRGPIDRRPVAPDGGGLPSRALTRVAPVAPETATPTSTSHAGQPLSRSGLNLLDVLTTTDAVASRPTTGTVALEVGLEQARGALLRNLPGDALTALDGVWDRAQRTEEGWYLRSGALAVMGLPGESERVAEAGLSVRSQSLALRFVQSFARMAVGDFTGARAALQPALQRAPFDALLVVQHALLQARSGDIRGAEATVARLRNAQPDHPALAWGRAALLAFSADSTRAQVRRTPIDWPITTPSIATTAERAVWSATDDIFPQPTPTTAGEDAVRGPNAGGTVRGDTRAPSGDVLSTALERFGARVTMRPAAEIAREARMLIRAFSAGGTLSTAMSGDQAHAARVVLTTFLGAATGEPTDAPAPLRTVVEQLLPLLQQGRLAEAERAVRRVGTQTREPIGRLLLAVLRGAGMESADVSDSGESPVMADVTTPSVSMPVVRGEVERGPLIPVRLGLSLLEETSAARVSADRAAAAMGVVRTDVSPLSPAESGDGARVEGEDPEGRGRGWGAAQALARSGAAAPDR